MAESTGTGSTGTGSTGTESTGPSLDGVRLDGVRLDGVRLDGERLTLRPWQERDVDALVTALAGDAAPEFPNLPRPRTRADAAEFVRRAALEREHARAIDCALVRRSDDRLVGSATLRLPVGGRACDIGCWIAPDARGSGFAAEATRVLAHWAYEHGVHRVEVQLDVRDVVSARVALAAGFRFESIRRDLIRDRDGRHDGAVFVRTADDDGQRVPAAFPALPPEGLTDGVITLRVPRPGDLDAFAEQERDPVTLANGFTGAARPPEQMARLLSRAGLDHLVGPVAMFGIVESASGRYAGTVLLRPGGPPGIGGIGYALHPASRGRGLTTRALRVLGDWAFTEIGYARLELGAKTGNIASQRAALGAGFLREGVMPGRLRAPDATFHDEARFYLLNPATPRVP